jgi:hypothetical protein
MNDTVKRAVRTFFQGAVGVFAIIAIPALGDLVGSVKSGGTAEVDVNFWSGILIAAFAGGIISLVAFVQNLIEDKVPQIDTR